MSTAISTIEGLAAIASNLAGTYHLTCDLDFNDDDSYADPLNKPTYTTGAGWAPVSTFTGIFDGQNYCVTHLYFNRTVNDQGLFGTQSGTVRNLRLRDVSCVSTGTGIGPLVGNNRGKIERCSVTGGSVQSGGTAGALVGRQLLAASGSGLGIYECSASGVMITRTALGQFGGLVGLHDRSHIQDSWVNCDVSLCGTSSVGGCIGYSTGTSTRCVSATYVGSSTTTRKGYTGNTGSGSSGSANFWDTEASGNIGAREADPLTTAEAKSILSYTTAGWDIVAVAAGVTDTAHTWNLVEGESYPFLSWQENPIAPAVTRSSHTASLGKQLHLRCDGSHEGIRITDVSGHGRDATLAPATTPTWIAEAPVGFGSYRYNNAQFADLAADLGYTTAFSAFAWFRSQGTPGDGYHVIFGPTGLEISIPTAGALRIGINTSTGRHVHNHGSGLTDGQWHHVGMTFDGVTKIGYIDGVEVGRADVTGTLTAVFSSRRIGVFGTTTSYFTNGDLADPRIYATALSAADVKTLAKTRTSLDNGGNLWVHGLQETQKPLLVPYTVWEAGQVGTIAPFSVNGAASENHRILGPNPWGKEVVLWEALPDDVSGPDGGWNQSAFAVDRTKMYRVSTWVWRNISGTGKGGFYLGTNGFGSTAGVYARTTGTLTTNPYFFSSTTAPTIGVWELVVGHIWPAGSSTGTLHADSGRYTVAGGRVANTSQDFVWHETTTTARHRTYLYYCTDTDVRMRWAYPRMEICDGSEPTIAEMLAGYDPKYFDMHKNGLTSLTPFSIGGVTNVRGVEEASALAGTTKMRLGRKALLLSGEIREDF